jgi:type I restriction enzyme, R subunit
MTQIREEVGFTKGRIIVRGKLVTRGKAKRADYILYYKPNIPLALIEAKDNNHSVGDGMQQALEYADARHPLRVLLQRRRLRLSTTAPAASGAVLETNLPSTPSRRRTELWARYRAWKGLTPEAEQIVLQDYYDDGSGKAPRYYQVNAVNAAIEAIAKGQDRILLVMATGTGKTYTAFQIIWRLWKAGRKKRILFLADRNVLIDQTMVNDFRPFGGAMAKLSAPTPRPSSARTAPGRTAARARQEAPHRHRLRDLSRPLPGHHRPEERQKLFREFSPGFFDLIVIDECHRGSAAEDSAWREILDHFPPPPRSA